MTAETSERKLSRLESLPAELLNRIYRYAVLEDGVVVAAILVRDTIKRWKSNEPALSRICKRVRNDVLPIYYFENIFTWPELDKCTFEGGSEGDTQICAGEINAWLNAIGESASLINRVGVSSPSHIWVGGHQFRLESEITMMVSEDTDILTICINGPHGERVKCESSLRLLEGDESAGETVECFDKIIGRQGRRSVSQTMLLCMWAVRKDFDFRVPGLWSAFEAIRLEIVNKRFRSKDVNGEGGYLE